MAHATKPRLKLYDAVGTGIILCCDSGVYYTNQTGGTFCLQPEVEGVYLPLRNDYRIPELTFESPELDLSAYFCGPKYRGTGAIYGLDEEDANFIDGILDKVRLSPSVRVDRRRLKDSHEAWVYVTILGNEASEPDSALFANFAPYPRQGVLTWANSD